MSDSRTLLRFEIFTLPVTFLVVAILMLFPCEGEAVTRVGGSFSLEETYATGAAGTSNLVEGGFLLDIVPQTKKNLHSRFSIPLRFSVSDAGSNMETSPVGNFTADIGGEWYNANLQYGRFATISSTAELTETSASRIAFTLLPPDLPKFFATYSQTETTTSGVSTQTDTLSLFSDYRYKWMNFRGGYSSSERSSGIGASLASSSLLFGLGGSYELLPRTTVTGDYDFNLFDSELATGGNTTTTTNSFRVSADTRPLDWFGLGGVFTRNMTDFGSDTTEQEFQEGTASFYPARPLRIYASLGKRNFDDVSSRRSVNFKTIGGTFSERMHEKVLVGLNVSRSFESDPGQGENTRDSFGLNAVMDITPRISLRMNLNVSRTENENFISTRGFDTSGTLADRDALDIERGGLPAGYVFFDTVNSNIYTKNSQAIGDWQAPVFFEPVTEHFSINKNLQVNMFPTDKTSLIVSYSSSASADTLDIARIGNQTLNGSLSYIANSRTSYSLSGTATLPERGNKSYSGTATMAYRFFRAHQFNLSYSRQSAADRQSDTLSSTLGLSLAKRAGLDITYSSSQLFQPEQNHFIKLRFSKSF